MLEHNTQLDLGTNDLRHFRPIGELDHLRTRRIEYAFNLLKSSIETKSYVREFPDIDVEPLIFNQHAFGSFVCFLSNESNSFPIRFELLCD